MKLVQACIQRQVKLAEYALSAKSESLVKEGLYFKEFPERDRLGANVKYLKL